jgi:hypothetical protein
VEGTRVSMEAKEVCGRWIFTKLSEICSQYNLLESRHGDDPKITILEAKAPKKCTSIPLMVLFET